MEIKNITLGGYASNCYFVWEGNDAVLVECSAEPQDIRAMLQTTGTTLRAVLLTHGHYDHYMRMCEVRAEFAVPFYLHKDDAHFPESELYNAYHVFHGYGTTFPPADHLVSAGDELCFGALCFSVLHTPGHTPGSALYRVGNALFTGDTLMACGYGRTTFAGGNTLQMRDSLKKIAALPQHLTIFPGHGESTMLGTAIHNIFR